MTTKYTPLNKALAAQPLSPVRNAAFKFCFGSYEAFLPTRIPLHVSNLKPKTRYKVFVRTNDDQGPQEDVTKFCIPTGTSLVDNPRDTINNYLVSSEAGSLSVEISSIGTSSIDPTNQSWASYWRHLGTKTPGDDLGRSDFIFIEHSKVLNPDSTSKYKTINVAKPASITTPLISESAEDRYIKQDFIADYVQTFFVDPNSVENSKSVDLTSATLYFRTKPEQRNNKSGIDSPGCMIALVDVENDRPVVGRQYKGSVVQTNWGSIATTGDATAATKFVFDDVVRVKPGEFYAIAVAFEDPDYDVWACRMGDLLVGTNTPSAGPNREHRGSLFQLTNESTALSDTNFDTLYTAQADRDLKFDVEVARYNTGDPIAIDMINRPMEFLSIGLNNGDWHGSEYVYADKASFTVPGLSIAAGSYDLTYTGPNDDIEGISIGESFVISEGGKTAVLAFEFLDTAEAKAMLVEPSPYTFTAAASITRTAIGIVDYFDPYNNELFLLDSSARPVFLFVEGETIIGVESGTTATIESINEFPVSVFSTNLDMDLPNEFSVTPTYQFALPNGTGGFDFRADGEADATLLREPNYVTSYPSTLLSRSLEIAQAGNLANDTNDPYSTKHRLTFESAGGKAYSYTSPDIEIDNMSLVTHFWVINNIATNEHTNQGTALTKHISNKLTFDNGEAAEDIRVVVNAYKPVGTDVQLFAKILNNQDGDAFDDKHWTPLAITSGAGQTSDANNQYDYKEFEYGFPSNLASSAPHAGAWTSTLDSNVITCSDTVTLSIGDIIKLYDPLFKDQNFGIFSVEDVAGNDVTLNEPIETNNLVGTNLRVDTTVDIQHTAYNNPLNDGLVRYFDFESAPHDGYSTVAIKIVLLAESTTLVPKVDDYRVVGVTV